MRAIIRASCSKVKLKSGIKERKENTPRTLSLRKEPYSKGKKKHVIAGLTASMLG